MSRIESINGIGSIDGGNYDSIGIYGMGTIRGDVCCDKIGIEGRGKLRGKVESNELHIDGFGTFLGDVRIKTLTINGLMKVLNADVEADRIECTGMISCNQEVSADIINMHGGCAINRMVGDDITIDCNNVGKITLPSLGSIFFGQRVSNTAATVEQLECTCLKADHLTAKVIRAKHVTLGADCNVETLEYDGELTYDSSCCIGSIIYGGKQESGSKVVVKEVKAYKETKANKEAKVNKETVVVDAESETLKANSVSKILSLFKDGVLSAAEAEQMIGALNRRETVVVQQSEETATDDDTLRNR